MEAVVPVEIPVAAPVLGYALQQQRRWERGVRWLVWIVCVTLALSLPLGACEWISTVHDGLTGSPHVIDSVAIIRLLCPLASLAALICGFLLLLRIRHARGAFVICDFFTVLLWVLQLVFTAWDARTSRFSNQPYVFLIYLNLMVMICYPLVLLSVALMRKSWRASGIWWMTAGAAMLATAPTVYRWVTNFENAWVWATMGVFSWRISGDFWRTVQGVGVIADVMACFSVFAAVAWTLIRGTSGRWAMMICAALWVVYAVAFSGVALGTEVYHRVFSGLPFGTFDEVMRPLLSIAANLWTFAVYLAFPLAIRAALMFTDVRAKLEGRAVEGGLEE